MDHYLEVVMHVGFEGRGLIRGVVCAAVDQDPGSMIRGTSGCFATRGSLGPTPSITRQDCATSMFGRRRVCSGWCRLHLEAVPGPARHGQARRDCRILW